MQDSALGLAVVVPISGDRPRPAISVVIPTRNEADNVLPLLRRLEGALRSTAAEVIFVDDSDDTTPTILREAQARTTLPVRVLHRSPGERRGGLGSAVVVGLTHASAPWAVVMDGDLQHPPEVVPALVALGVKEDADVVVASRDGNLEGLSGSIRVAASGLATTAARLVFRRSLRAVSDPMTGFFAVRPASLKLTSFRPQGFKILLELLVRGEYLQVIETPFSFESRHAGRSKASWREGVRFLHLLLLLKLAVLAPPLVRARLRRAAAFAAVGATGVAVNSGLLWLLVNAGPGMHYTAAAVLATQGASAWNFVWADRWVFAGPKPLRVRTRFLRFTALNNLCLVVALPLLVLFVSVLGLHYLLASVLTTGIVFVARFLMSERLVYRSRGFVALLRTTGPSPVAVAEDEAATA